MNLAIDVLKLRRVVLDYVSPPICPVLISTSGTILTAEDISGPTPPTGVRIGGLCNRFVLWDFYKDLEGMSFYISVDSGQTFILLVEGMDANTVAVISPGWWKIAARLPNGETGLSDPVLVDGSAYVFLTIPEVEGATGFNLYKNPISTDVNAQFYLVASETSNGAFEINSSTSCFAHLGATIGGSPGQMPPRDVTPLERGSRSPTRS